MTKQKQIKTVTLTFEQYTDPEAIFPSRFMFRNEVGDYVFLLTSKRSIAQEYLSKELGGKFSLREV